MILRTKLAIQVLIICGMLFGLVGCGGGGGGNIPNNVTTVTITVRDKVTNKTVSGVKIYFVLGSGYTAVRSPLSFTESADGVYTWTGSKNFDGILVVAPNGYYKSVVGWMNPATSEIEVWHMPVTAEGVIMSPFFDNSTYELLPYTGQTNYGNIYLYDSTNMPPAINHP